MILAHTIGSGGPEIDVLIFAGALLVLGVALFVQKAAKPAISVVLILAAFAIAAGSFALAGAE